MKAISRNLGLLVLLLVTAATFSPSLTGSYVYDDHRFIKQNPFMDAPLDLAAPFIDPVTMEVRPVRDIYRPLRTVVFRIEHALGNGSPLFHHLAGLGIHLINVFLVFLLVRRWMAAASGPVPQSSELSAVSSGPAPRVSELSAASSASSPIEAFALLGAGVFALHPLQVESVAWISSRGDQLVALFLLVTLLWALDEKGRKSWVQFIPTMVLTLLACFSKESGIITGGVILLGWACFDRFRSTSTFLHGAVAIGAAGIYLLARSALTGSLQGQVPPHGGEGYTNLFYACFGTGYQALLILRPWFSNVDYQDGFFDSLPFSQVLTFGSLFPLLLIASLVVFRKNRPVFFSLLLFCICLLPTSSLVFPLRSLVNDRYLYIPMVAIALLVAAGLSGLTASRNRFKPVVRLAMVVLLAMLAAFSFARSMHWKDGESLWLATLKTHPQSIKARLGLGRAWFNEGKTERALAITDEALELTTPGTSLRTDTLYLKAQALTRLGQIESAIACLVLALDESTLASDIRNLQPRLGTICKNLWDFKMKAGHHEGALALCEELIRLEGLNALNLLLKGRTLRALGRISEAESVLNQAVALYPEAEELQLELSLLRAVRTKR